MTAQQLMSTPPRTCRPTTDLAAVTRLMRDCDCGVVAVVDASGHPVGVVTDRDICVATAAHRRLPNQVPAAEVMTRQLHNCLVDDSIDQALATMKAAKVRRLPVVDGTGHLEGVLSLNDVVRAVGTREGPTAEAVVDTLAAICAPRAVALTA
jgi:CBS domain-containing protein